MSNSINTGTKTIALIFGILAGLILLGYFLPKFFTHSQSKSKIEVDWKLLGELDYVTGSAPTSLKKYDGEFVKVPGFMVPLEDNQKKVTQFLLVPTPQACIHVPPPPPNQMLLVDVKEGTETAYGPIWVHGILKINTQRTLYGDVSFSFDALYIEPYQ